MKSLKMVATPFLAWGIVAGVGMVTTDNFWKCIAYLIIAVVFLGVGNTLYYWEDEND